MRLLARDDERRALLIERCVPGTRLWDAGVDETTVIGELLPRLQVEVDEASHPFRLSPTRRSAGRTTFRAGTRRRAGPFERVLARFGGRRLPHGATARRRWLVNQDLHGGNVLRAEREPWLVIDPKPLVGERELEAQRAPPQRRLDVSRWLDALAELGLDRERARGWGVAHNLAWAWDERRGWLERPRRGGAADPQRAMSRATKNPAVPWTCGSVCRNSGRRGCRNCGHSSASVLSTSSPDASTTASDSSALIVQTE